MSFDSCYVAEKLEAAMKAMVVTVAKHLEKAQQSLAARIADTFTILWYTTWSNSFLHLALNAAACVCIFQHHLLPFWVDSHCHAASQSFAYACSL